MRFAAAAGIGILVFLAAPAIAGTTSYTYDALGRVIHVTYEDGSQVDYTYDAAGNRTQVVQAVGP